MMRSAERLDVAEKFVHLQLMRRICPSRQGGIDGYVRKLWATPLPWDISGMGEPGFDLDLIQRVLREATSGDPPAFSQRGLGIAAGVGRDFVGDVLNGRNKNPTTRALSKVAKKLGGDLTMFGFAEEREEPPTEGELEAALRDNLPGMPRGSLDKRARYLAEAVGRALRLPQARPATERAPLRPENEVSAPPPAPTN